MFQRIENLILQIFTDLQTTFIWIFAIGILACSIMIGFGSEENAPRFKKGLIFCIVGAVIFLLAKPVIQYIQTNL